MEIAERERLIARYQAGYDEIVAALAGITDTELDTPEAPGEWSPRQIAHHLADSEMTSAIRLRRLLAEENPLIIGYDQEEFARKLHYDRPIEPSLLAFRYARESTAAILHALSEAEWLRGGRHNEYGSLSVEEWLIYYASHAHDHADQIRRARGVASRDKERVAAGND
jgi:hypothetical protein